MTTLKLNADWSKLLTSYRADHQDPRNQACHAVGIPMIAASFPVGATIVGLPLAAWLFTVGWGFQFAGHYFEGKPPAFTEDKRQLIVGHVWWAEKRGLLDVRTSPAAAAA